MPRTESRRTEDTLSMSGYRRNFRLCCSHKNDRWGKYAAATEAACAKELLKFVPSQEVKELETALELMKDNKFILMPSTKRR